jgi:hypothetical protein
VEGGGCRQTDRQDGNEGQAWWLRGEGGGRAGKQTYWLVDLMLDMDGAVAAE